MWGLARCKSDRPGSCQSAECDTPHKTTCCGPEHPGSWHPTRGLRLTTRPVREWLAVSDPHGSISPSPGLWRRDAARSTKVACPTAGPRAPCRALRPFLGRNAKEQVAHSMRSGLVTPAKRGDADDQVVMRQTAHCTSAMIDHRTTREVATIRGYCMAPAQRSGPAKASSPKGARTVFGPTYQFPGHCLDTHR